MAELRPLRFEIAGAYPGHYVQFLWVQTLPSKVRKLLGAGTNVEGWAHYCEQMMMEAGYGDGDRKLRLGQLQDALLRDARYVVGIRMHTGGMTYEQGIDFFVKEGYQSRANAERETRRGTSDPTYLVYTLGKLEILKLRDDYRKMKGPAFSLQDFHDQFMRQGFPPIRVTRRALLGDDSPALYGRPAELFRIVSTACENVAGLGQFDRGPNAGNRCRSRGSVRSGHQAGRLG